jgi:hypothetical protein
VLPQLTFMRKLIITVLVLFSVSFGLLPKLHFQLSAGTISVSISNTSTLTYQVNYKGKPVIKPSQLAFKLTKPKATLAHFEIIKVDSLVQDDTWTPVWGEVNKIKNHYKELTLTLPINRKAALR